MARETVHFGTDGIRGVAGKYPLDLQTVRLIGRAIGRWLLAQSSANPTVLIGRDTRESSPSIGAALADGLSTEGVLVLPIGQVTTPELAFLTCSALDQPIGIMITASHNPYEQNGIKVFASDGFKLADADETQIEAGIAQLQAELSSSADSPSVAVVGESDLFDLPAAASEALHISYQMSLLSDLPNDLVGLSVILDCANGAASGIADQIFRQAGAQVTVLNAAPDGRNINQGAGSEYVRRDRSALRDAVQDAHADLGIAFDGDADRVVFVTPSGMLLDGDHAIGLLAIEFQRAEQLPGAAVVVTDMSNSGLVDYLAAHSIATIRTKVGDRYVMDRMRVDHLILGGEQAGHVILLDNNARTAGDGIYAGLRIAAIVATAKRIDRANINVLDKLATLIPRYPQVIASATMPRSIDLTTLPALSEVRAQAMTALGGTGRINIRFSGTEPNLLRVMVEGGPTATLTVTAEQARLICRFVGSAVDDPNPVVDLVDCMTGAPL